MFDYNSKLWKKLSDKNLSYQTEFEMIYHEKYLYIVGGKINDIVTKSCQRYDFKEREW